ncbi:bifunctional metallophosphatase/5'-nucleotidase [Cellulosilyticum ruminicola]|uniref:bifunctional metallophosphatase/5'-nucleotidase n=1 Tax=Cellulosilyticum ruminicola TaxID=425254 RepID=UPI0006D207C7|nr:bifunctional UDP-sugar hydrolase/5'-nucleotidase [Cellulosilyticum ruminicola]
MKRILKMYYTSDTHGYLFPTDYITKSARDMGVLSCINEFEKDGNTLILDGGDTIQGSVFVKYMWENSEEGFPIAEAFNTAPYDYIALGNHDFNYDYTGLQKYLETLHAGALAANVVDKAGKLNLKPYVIHTLENGLKVGLVGIVTDYVNLWERPEHLTNLEVKDTFEAAKVTLEEIKDQCDVTVCIYHGGFEADLTTGLSLAKGKENVGYRICKELNYDVLLTAHQHMPVEGRMLHGTYTLQLPANAQKYAEVLVEVKENGELEITSTCKAPKAIEMRPKTIAEVGTHGSVQLANKWFSMQQAVEEWLDKKLGGFTEEIPDLDKLTLALEGSRLADFCNQLQLELSGADFSCISLGNNPIGFKKEVTTRDVMGAYQFPNTVKVLEVDERVLRQALERCAEYYTLEANGEVVISDCFINPKVEHYNYDFFAGLSYTFDLTKPVGERVVEILKDGQTLGDKKYTLAMSDYRATGTGGYECYQECEVVKEYDVDIQALAIEYIKKHQVVEIMAKPDFKIIITK